MKRRGFAVSVGRKQRRLYVLPDEPRQLTTGGTIFSEIDKLND